MDAASLIKSHRGTKFDWGSNDCTTMALKWSDSFGHNSLRKVFNKYHDRKSGYRFQKQTERLTEILIDDGWKQITEPPKNGDLIIYDDGMFDNAHIVYMGWIFSMDEKDDLVSVPFGELDWADPSLSIWRHYGI